MMQDDLPPIRESSEIMPAICVIGGIEGRCESILFEGRRFLVLNWVVPAHKEWMQPRRLVLIEGLEFEVQSSPELIVLVHTELPADAMPDADPTQTAAMTFVLDYPQTLFRAHRMN